MFHEEHPDPRDTDVSVAQEYDLWLVECLLADLLGTDLPAWSLPATTESEVL